MLTQKQLAGNDQPMPPTKIKAFMEEFPWVKVRLEEMGVGESSVRKVYVFRIEPDLLTYSPASYEYLSLFPFSLGRDLVYEDILLLDAEGRLVTREIQRSVNRKKYWLFGAKQTKTRAKLIRGVLGHYDHTQSTVGHVLEALGDMAGSVRFVLSYFRLNGAVILYKSPTGLSVGEWISQQLQAERVEFQQAVANIDAEAK